ncbi:MAG: ABC transporter ATP-binding protein [Akkermansiaceae bacterium]
MNDTSSSNSKEPLIRIRGLHKHFGESHVLRGVDLDIYRGETVCLLGVSGGGKSVLVKHILALLEFEEGSVQIDGVEITGLSERKLAPIRKKLGMMFQNGALFDSMTVSQNVAFPLVERGMTNPDKLDQRVQEVLEIVKLPEQQEKMPSDLSGGMKKRVALARAIIDHPTCVCYDEPHAGLDPVTADTIDKLIKCLQHDHGIANIVITHELRSVFRIADRIVFMKDGQVYWQGTSQEMQASADPIITQFISGSDGEGDEWND